MQKFARVFHLVGEQPVPIFMGALHVEAGEHVLLVSEKTRPTGENILQELVRLGLKSSLSKTIKDPYDMPALFSSYTALLDKTAPGAIGFNVTGGTKPMFATVFMLLSRHPSSLSGFARRCLAYISPVGQIYAV